MKSNIFSLLRNYEEKPKQLYRRVSMEGDVIIHDNIHLYMTKLRNISGGGVFLKDLVSIKEGENVRLIIKSQKLEKAIQAKGKVVRIEKNPNRGLAVEFTSISKEDRQCIENSVYEQAMEEALKII